MLTIGTTNIEVSVVAFGCMGNRRRPWRARKPVQSVQNAAGGNILLEADDIKTMWADAESLGAPL